MQSGNISITASLRRFSVGLGFLIGEQVGFVDFARKKAKNANYRQLMLFFGVFRLKTAHLYSSLY
jgi:hypothetical protein